MIKKFKKNSPDILVIKWDGRHLTLLEIIKLLKAFPAFNATISAANSANLILSYMDEIGEHRSICTEGNYLVIDNSHENPRKKVFVCDHKFLFENYNQNFSDELPGEMSKEKLLTFNDYLTLGKLKEFTERFNIPDSAPVVVQRVEDYYYQRGNWESYFKGNEHSYSAEKFNEDLDKGEYDDRIKYPNAKPETLKKFTEHQIKQQMSQYHPAFCCVYRKDDNDILFIDLHY